jgi:hypothetical protein
MDKSIRLDIGSDRWGSGFTIADDPRVDYLSHRKIFQASVVRSWRAPGPKSFSD